MLPESLDPDTLRQLAIGALVVLAVVAFLVLRFVQKIMLRLVVLVLVIALGIGVWFQRAELGDCAKTCDCKMFGFDVQVPDVGCQQLQRDA